MQTVTFKNRFEEELRGTLHLPETQNGLGFVLGHCFTCSRHTRVLIDLSNTLAGLGLSVLRFDFSGNGQSQGRFEDSTYTKQIGEMTAAVAFMKQRGAEQVLIGGHSMGAMVSLFTASETGDIAGVIALATGAAPMHPDRVLTPSQKQQLQVAGQVPFSSRGRDLTLNRAFFEDAGQYRLEEAIARIRCPVLLVLASEDAVTDPQPVKTLLADRPPLMDLLEVPGADHMFSSQESRKKVMDHVSQWILNHFSGGA